VQSNAPCPVPDTAVSSGITTGINSLQFANSHLQVYPNPGKGDFFVEGNYAGHDGMVKIEVLNAIGQVVYNISANIENGKLQKEIHLNTANGLYILKLTDESGSSLLHQIVVNK
jgi:hypothetical protein